MIMNNPFIVLQYNHKYVKQMLVIGVLNTIYLYYHIPKNQFINNKNTQLLHF